jgi:hypothetical protein
MKLEAVVFRGHFDAQSIGMNLDQIAGHLVSGAAVSGMIPVHRGAEAAGASVRRKKIRAEASD